MEIIHSNSAVSPTLEWANDTLERISTGKPGFHAVLTKTESAASLQGSHNLWRKTDSAMPSSMNSGAAINTLDRLTGRAPNGPVSGPNSPNPGPAPEFHTVRSGETLYGISKKVLEARGLEVTPATVMRAVARLGEHNGIADRNRIYPNQKLNTAVLNDSPGKRVAEILNSPSSGGDSFHPFVVPGGYISTLTPEASSKNVPHTDLKPSNLLTASEFLANSNKDSWRESPGKYFDSRPNIDLVANANSPTSPEQLSGVPDVGSKLTAPQMVELQRNDEKLVDTTSPTPQSAERLHDLFYKGAIGKALDYVPMEPEIRMTLQKAGSVASGTGTALKLGGLLGVATPIAAVVGFIWGIFSAQNIDPTLSANKPKE